MSEFHQLLLDLRNEADSKREQGTLFEKVMVKFFQTSPLYADIYEKVWMWVDFPYRGGKNDIGIDLVAKKKDFDEYAAIQCKFYSETNPVSKDDIDTFLSASGQPFFIDGKPIRYSERIIVSTNDKWTSNAESIIEGQIPPVNRIRLQDLEESGIDWASFNINDVDSMKRSIRKNLLPHQKEALTDVCEGFVTHDRGKLIMACGTGKTFTSLKIAETLLDGNGSVLFMVPSISLLNQSLLEWSTQTKYDCSIFAICSDSKATSNSEGLKISDAIIPATTNVDHLVSSYALGWKGEGLKLFFSTYQSIEVIAEFQKQTGLVFDLVVCDEAHRTTGVTLAGDDDSNFVKIHNNDFIKAQRRLYMTATPRIYAEETKNKASQNSAVLCSMDDEEIFGPEFHYLGFGEAVGKGLLSDYKVIVLAVDEGYVSRALQNLLTDRDNELTLEDSVKIIGCLNGLSKRTIFADDNNDFANDPSPMRKAVAFTNTISASKKFVQLCGDIQNELKFNGLNEGLMNVELEHVDGKHNALIRKQKIDWLKERTDDNTCRVLSNAQCLSEGIDVPALDAVMFLNPKKSIIDIIQAVGRVMRKADGKQLGYIILPIGIPAGVEPEEALNDNQKYKIVWDVLQALRAHDDRFNNTINKIELNKRKPSNIQIIGVSGRENSDGGEEPIYTQLTLNTEDLSKWKDSIYARIVKKCGSRKYWETWAKDIAEIADRHVNSIKLLVNDSKIEKKFNRFLKALQKNLNSSITADDAIEMLAEHMITKPVFDALFEDYEFIKQNPVSVIMQEMLDILDEKALDKEQETLDKFYLSVHERAKGIDNAEGKQKIVIELYEQFFKQALPKQVEKLGIVYTPVEVVDFIVNSVEVVLNERFNISLSDRGVHVLDPFTGTGTFIVRLLKSGIIKKEDLLYKYTNELHANEIVLLAYYIAAINIEETYHDLMETNEYTPFEGIVLTDTFALSESIKDKDGMDSDAFMETQLFSANSDRAKKQLKEKITVIIGNPPYSVGQGSANDNNKNLSYPLLEQKLANTYAEKSEANLKRNVYDSYIKAFRWATDRLGENGVIAFVSNGAYLDGVALDGFRKCLIEDFNYIYVFNLRGNQRTSGELSRKEGGKIFGSGSRNPIAITILVKKKGVKKDGYIRYHDIGDYLSREQKLEVVSNFESIKNIQWSYITPNDKGDWLNQRDAKFDNHIALGDKKKREKESYFMDNYSSGLSTNRDVWVYGFNKSDVIKKANQMIDYYNNDLIRCYEELEKTFGEKKGAINKKGIDSFLDKTRSLDSKKISWSSGLFNKLCRNENIKNSDEIRLVAYRPFCKKYLFYNKDIIERPSKWDSIFPDNENNVVISVSGAPVKKGFSVLITDCIQDLNYMEHTISMPLYIYDRVEEKDEGQISLFDLYESEDIKNSKPKYKRRYAISDVILNKYKMVYGERVTKEDIFYYLYAILQSSKYINEYASSLEKEMPRIPLVDKFSDYVNIGRELADLHLNYEKIDISTLDLKIDITKEDYQVNQMKFKKKGKEKIRDTIIFNDYITISNIPEKAYEYVINGKSAIEWIMERYARTIDKESGIEDNPNIYTDDSKYIFELLLKIIALSVKTIEIREGMPDYNEK